MTSEECMLQAFAMAASARCVFSKKLDRSARICSRLVIDSLTLVSCMFEPMSKRERERERERASERERERERQKERQKERERERGRGRERERERERE